MKPAISPFVSLLLLSGLFLACGCSSATKSTRRPIAPTVELSGTSNAPITGYYIAESRRVELTGVLPQTIRAPGLSQLAVRKRNSEDTLVLTARTPAGSASQSLRPQQEEGLRLLLDGLSLSTIPPQETLDLPNDNLIVFVPYWYEGTWVFDDATKGLQHEPLFSGAPELLNSLVKDIPDAREGFRLTCSAKPFPGTQQKLLWVRAEAEGNYYGWEAKAVPGRLGPAMFRYSAKTPKVLYLKAESKKAPPPKPPKPAE